MAAAAESLGPSVGTMPAPAFDPKAATPEAKLDEKLARLKDRQRAFARTSPAEKARWVRELQARLVDVAPRWVSAACKAKGIDESSPLSGEEWIAGPALTIRNCRLLAGALDEIAQGGKPALDRKRIRRGPHGGLAVGVVPYDAFDGAVAGGLSGETWLEPGIEEAELPANQAVFYDQREPEGGLSLILGAGNVASIAPMDALYKMFVEGEVCVVKMNPVNEYLGPFFEEAFAPLIKEGFIDVVYGGAEVGSYLSYSDAVDDIHITGSDKTHDMIVWGPPGAERERRKAEDDPILKKRITSELGNVSPVMVVPGPYTEAELGSMAENVAGMITNNGSFNCNAAKLLILPKGWPERRRFLSLVEAALAKVPPRKAYYPGAFDRYAHLTEGREDVRKIGSPGPNHLPWTLVPGLDPKDEGERNFYTEPFCAILSEVELGSMDPAEFLEEAVAFANDRVWGTLNAMLFVHPRVEGDPALAPKVDRALAALRYGTVAVNIWPAMSYAFVTTPWGGHPSATLKDIQSGLGWVHNTPMLEKIEKGVIRGPLKAFPKLAYFPGHRTLDVLGKKLVAFEASPSWLKVPAMAMAALRG
jgi:acyl-CoA reductase-like NAD-dependent aldehyde dehydrogenase